ncbi:hypothetical protein SteCoe_12855 [Stentor coeruleus]|uniref:Uncharacterized protein n=1 Tax=Stentor coeruleus TaxID=5963 RepID=A0A1R2C9Z1_9CILI|nr:hypothetical protein SteCoe_12855 [Stentor coeruleus]
MLLSKSYNRIPFPYDTSNILKDFFMTWMIPVLKYYKTSKPSLTNILHLPKRLNYKQYTKALKISWKEELQKEKPNFFRALLKVIKKDAFSIILTDILAFDSLLFQALIMIKVINYIEDPTSDDKIGIIWVVLFLLGTLIISMTLNVSSFRFSALIAVVKGLITRIIYKKLLKINLSAVLNNNSSAKILSVISSDLELLDSSFLIMFLCSFPLMMIGTLTIMIVYFGVSGLLGILVCIIQIPIIYFLSKPIEGYRGKIAEISDKRVKNIRMLIEGIRIVKIYGWESSQLNAIYEIRKLQNSQTFRKNFFISTITGVGYSGLASAFLVTFGSYVWFGNTLKVADVFAGTTVLYLAFIELNFLLSSGLIQLFLTIVTMKRFQEVLLLPEISGKIEGKELKVKVKNGSFIWSKIENIENNEDKTERELIDNAKQEVCLEKINFSINRGLMVVTGMVGSGKSSLLLALLGEMEQKEGSKKISDSISYIPDQPWLLPDTIRKNIILGDNFDENKYNKILEICCLEEDLRYLKYNDLSIVGDQGITLSGGQKARVALARALYKDSDVYLLDDPLSALDIKTGQKILFNIKKFYNEKIVILTSHQAWALEKADMILTLSHGVQEFWGTYEEFIKFYNLKKIEEYFGLENIQEKEKEEILEVEEAPIMEKIDGSFHFGMLYSFLKMGLSSHFITIVIILLFVSVSALNSGIGWWITYWVDANDQKNNFYVFIIIGFILASFIAGFLRSLIFSHAYLNSARVIHNKSLEALAYSPTSFYDQNPTGRILTRFTRDIIVIDEPLYETSSTFFSNTLEIIAITISIIIIVPYNLIILAIAVVGVYFLVKNLAILIKELRAIDLASKSYVLNIFNSTLHGISTIRAHNLQKKFSIEGKKDINRNIRAYFTYNCILLVFRTYTEFLATLISLANIVLIVLLRSQINPTLAALSLSLNVSMTGLVNIWAKGLIELNNLMSSPQRLFEYSELPNEGIMNSKNSYKIERGEIEFRDICLRYRPDLDLALNGLNIKIPAGCKLGIMGRTGAGKSSILVTLLRLANPESGVVLIDGKDYMNLGLADLRSQISVIPQSPVIFFSSIRENVDPFRIYSDEKIQETITSIGLGNSILKLQKGIHSIYGEEAFLSTGQKQLLCLARALVKDSKILIIDEATANVDKESEEIIHNSIKSMFEARTVLIIAHRLSTIKQCDKVAIISEGKCKHLITPREAEEYLGS